MNASLTSQRARVPGGGGPVARRGLLQAAGKCIPPLVFICLPAFVLGNLLYHAMFHVDQPIAYWDFHAFWHAGNAVLHGHSPYPPASAAVLAHENAFVYPAPAAIAMVPFSVIPFTASAVLFALLAITSILVALRIVGVRDYRCYGIALLSEPIVSGVVVGAVTPLLMLGVALLWRYRNHTLGAAAAVAAIVMLKLFLWPFVLWLAFTRRLKTALIALALIAVVTVASWAVLGFASFRNYPNILHILTHLLEGKGYSFVSLGLSLGAGRNLSQALPWIVGGAALALIGLRGRERGSDGWTFIVAIGAAFALSPIVWLHYFALLYIPIAIVRPRLSWLWAAPLVLWVCRGQSIDAPVWQKMHRYHDLALSPRIGYAPIIVYALLVVGTVIVLSARFATQRAER